MIGMDMTMVAANIRAARARKDINQGDLAKAIGVNIATVSSYERGEIVPGADKVFAMARALDVTPNDILGWHTSKAA